MLSTAKKLSVFSVILCFLNIFGAVLLLCSLPALKLNFTIMFSIVLFMITAVASAVLTVISLRSLYQDLDLNYESNSQRLHDMQKKIDELDARTKQ